MGARFDQHFLKDATAVQRICDQIDPSTTSLLEIGPGQGVLTHELLKRGWRVHAIEMDPILIPLLTERFSAEIASGQFVLTHGDALRIQLDMIPFEYVVSNLPYSISSPITFRLLEYPFYGAVLMYQKEFADRMRAEIGSRESGRLTIMVQTFAYITHCFDLSRNAFFPQPAVGSSVLKLQPKDPLFYIADREVYAKVVRELFSKRRKMVRTILAAAAPVFGEEKITELLSRLDPEILESRPENLYLEDYATIANQLI
ncbi:MAG: 16S ribosomal RNA methyltransferase A [Methanomicrobiales archaeon]|jgi:16S rRNA (adenine1518-N6/adenine1519-N6)-dimethyltransferase|nr:16S ribosomal RNA methyltransferase A [Methanomicrobiales archaeon]